MINRSLLTLGDLRLQATTEPRPLADATRALLPGSPARLAVLGDPVAHSRSPAMHQAALDEQGLAMRYVRLHVKPGEIRQAFDLMRALGYVGCNVTVPHKFEALEACDIVDAPARLFGAVNTVTFTVDGPTSGANTDGPGLAAAIREAFGRPLAGFRVAILGAGGGAGRAAALQCALDACPRLVLANRTVEKAREVAREAVRVAPDCQILATGIDGSAEFAAALASCDLLINATSVGMKPDDPLPCPSDILRPDLAVYDMIYNPPETPLLAVASALGAPSANGLSMLIHQGALAFVRWFGGPPPLAAMRGGLA